MTASLIAALQPILSRVRTDVTAKKAGGSTVWPHAKLSDGLLHKHLNGGAARGVCPIKEGESTTRLALLDFDSHKGEVSWDDMVKTVLEVTRTLKKHGLKPTIFRSSGGHGIHVFYLWDKPQDAYSVREHLKSAIGKIGYKVGTGGVAKKQIEIFPKQNEIRAGKYGNMFMLPLAAKSLPLDVFDSLTPLPREAIAELEWPVSNAVPVHMKPTPAKHVAHGAATDANLLLFREQLAPIDPDCDFDMWLNIGMALHYETGGSADGLALWDEWSSGDLLPEGQHPPGSYQGEDDLSARWSGFSNNCPHPITRNTIAKYAREAGWSVSAQDEFGELIPVKKALGRFHLHSADDYAEGADPQFMIDNVLPAEGMVMIVGSSGAGKTFLVADIAAHIALGIPWRGYAVRNGRVVYIAAEGASGFRKRIRACKKHHGAHFGDNFKIIDDVPNLLSADHEELAAVIERSGGAKVIIIDTLAQTTPGGDENSSIDMGKALGNCLKLKAATGALIVLVHHHGKTAGKGARGWSGLKAAMDTEIQVTKNGKKHFAKITKQKDGEEGQEFCFSLLAVNLGMSENGNAITSCVVQHEEAQSARSGRKLTGKWQLAIHDAVVTLSAYGKEYHSEEAILAEMMKMHPHDPATGRDQRKQKAIAALKGLLESAFLVEICGDIGLP